MWLLSPFGSILMILPPYLSNGDTIALVAPARKVTTEEMQPAIDFFSANGFKVTTGESLYKQCNQFAGEDELRSQDLQQAISDPAVKAILFARGGYGTARIIDQVNLLPLKSNPKWLIGFSDLTVIHCQVNKMGVATLHSPMAINIPKLNQKIKNELINALTGKLPCYKINESVLSDLNRTGKTEGILTGGNLSVIYSLLGTPSEPDTENTILFIEDLDEYLYHVDRMMLCLKRSGKLKNLNGLIVGSFSDMKDNAVPFGKTAEEIISEHVSEYDYPVMFGFPAGHSNNNRPVILGANARLNVSLDSELSYAL